MILSGFEGFTAEDAFAAPKMQKKLFGGIFREKGLDPDRQLVSLDLRKKYEYRGSHEEGW